MIKLLIAALCVAPPVSPTGAISSDDTAWELFSGLVYSIADEEVVLFDQMVSPATRKEYVSKFGFEHIREYRYFDPSFSLPRQKQNYLLDQLKKKIGSGCDLIYFDNTAELHKRQLTGMRLFPAEAIPVFAGIFERVGIVSESWGLPVGIAFESNINLCEVDKIDLSAKTLEWIRSRLDLYSGQEIVASYAYGLQDMDALIAFVEIENRLTGETTAHAYLQQGEEIRGVQFVRENCRSKTHLTLHSLEEHCRAVTEGELVILPCLQPGNQLFVVLVADNFTRIFKLMPCADSVYVLREVYFETFGP